MNNLNKTSITFSDLLGLKKFKIPDYQRAYAWEEKQINLFVSDLVEYEKNIHATNKKYYLGHFIFEKNDLNNEFEVVDGQQRLTTIFLFMLVCSSISKQKSIFDTLKFIPVSYDLNGFNSILSELNFEKNETTLDQVEINETASLSRMKFAVEFFKKKFTTPDKLKKNILDSSKIEVYLNILLEAYCSFVVFNDKSVSSQVFELHNTRGLPLTETEKVKSTLMKMVYMYSNSNEVNQNIKSIENDFAEIFKYEEYAKNVWFRGELSLDNILMYHLRAVEDGNKNEDFSKPFSISGENGCYEYIKDVLAKKDISEIVEYCKNVVGHFAISMKIISKDILSLDEKYPAIGDSILLNKDRSLIFYLRLLRSDNLFDKNQSKLFIRWEHFLFYNDLMDWSGFFYKKLNRENFHEIYQSLNDSGKANILLLQFYKADKVFASNWTKPINKILQECFLNKENIQDNLLKRIYGNSKINIAYLLYKFEISKSGIDYSQIRSKIFKGNQVSIDHIVAQNLSWDNFGYPDFDKLGKKEREIAEMEWNKVVDVIHGIGNLSLSITSSNSSDSNNPPQDHSETFKNFGLNHTSNIVKNWTQPIKFAYDINERGREILKFIEDEYILNKYWLYE
jgi:hypothetical protein